MLKRHFSVRYSAALAVLAGLAIAGLLFACGYPHEASNATAQVDFNRDIRPILNHKCTSCHGGVKQQGGVSFIYREEALGKGKSGRPVVVPGKPKTSELIARVTSDDPEFRMPLHAPALSSREIDLLTNWISQGAHWQDHWAFVAPKAQTLPEVVNERGWVRQPLDRFVLTRLEQEHLKPSPEADRSALLRRVSFDLIGLPPTPAELAAFLSDKSPDAFDKQVDRLLVSPRFGERWTSLWLDLARYADSKGYEQDGPRTVWPYRDWVINAFNRNLPYDKFVITQVAGDLLPGATLDDRIATAFHRQTPSNDEGGTDDEEFRMVAVMDRVATTWSVLNGLTMNCVQCHAHPYDPIRHEEYYRFLAFLNTSQDADGYFDDGPVVHVPLNSESYPDGFHIQKQISELTASVLGAGRRLAEETEQWKQLLITQATINASLGLDRQWNLLYEQGPALLSEVGDISPAQREKLFQSLLGEAEKRFLQIRQRPPQITSMALHDGEAWAKPENISAAAVSEFLAASELTSISAIRIEVLPEHPKIARHTPEEAFRIARTDAWIVHPDGREEKIVFGTFAPDENTHLTSQLALIGAKTHTPAPGPTAFPEQVRRGVLEANKLFYPRWIVCVPVSPLTLAPGSHIKVQLTQINNLATDVVNMKPAIARRVRLAASDDPRWTALAADPVRTKETEQLGPLYRSLSNLKTVQLPVMLQQSAAKQRETRRFDRGNFLIKIGPPLTPDVPAIFPKFTAATRDRLAMARWFFTPEQPLTARVAVNRFWEQLFGTGLVETLEDFGSTGEKPSHPELLDWLARHFQQDLKWNVKALLRELVLSATYRQRSIMSRELGERDPRNRLLARGPRQRLTAEMVRDQALFASGLLTSTVGGPPVMPPLPEGIKVTFGISGAKWTEARGADRYRRALYTYWQRTSPYPSAIAFDASGREVTLARRITTNTPLQALVTLNDTIHQEAAKALAQRMLLEPSRRDSDEEDLRARLNYGALLVLSRSLTQTEATALGSVYQDALREIAPRAQLASTALQHHHANAGAAELSAFTMVAEVLLNLDAAMTR